MLKSPAHSAVCSAVAALAALPLSCASKPTDGSPSASVSTPSPGPSASSRGPASIGFASMLPDGTLILDLTATDGPTRGHARVTYAPSDPKYQETLRHIGGLRPGEQKPVPPWPDTIDAAAVEAVARAYVAEKKGWTGERVRVEATGTYENGDVAATVTYSGDAPGKPMVARLRVDQKARRVVREFER